MANRKPLTYEQSGVNLSLGDYFSKTMADASRQTWVNRKGKFGQVEAVSDSFTSARAISLTALEGHDLENLMLDQPTDGIGTKIEISERIGDHATSAFNLIAMGADDPAAEGFEPIFGSNVIDVRKLRDKPETYKAIGELASGLIEACEAAGIVMLRGEVAELGNRVNGYGRFNYNWSVAVTSLTHRSRFLTGLKVEPGQALVGFKEDGFRSNGLSLVRSALAERYGAKWHDKKLRKLGNIPLGEQVNYPSRIYTKLMVELTGGYDINRAPRADVAAFAHITGGGQPGKLGRALEPSGYGALIDNPLEPLPIMNEVQRIAQVSDEEIYSTINMGTGLVGITAEPDRMIEVAAEFGIEARQIGRVTNQPAIRIKSQGVMQEGEWLVFERAA